MSDKIFCVAKYIMHLIKCPISTMKLQKLVYYSQCWSLVWNEKPLFENKIEAWANGPVVVDLYDLHKGKFLINEDFFKEYTCELMSTEEAETIKSVVKFYGKRDPQWLSDLTHSEQPWIVAREGLKPGERGNKEIAMDSMAEYYGSL